MMGTPQMIQFGSVLLLKAKNLSRHSNFSSIFYHIFRTKAAQTIGNATVCLSNAGTCIAQMSIIKVSKINNRKNHFGSVLPSSYSLLQGFNSHLSSLIRYKDFGSYLLLIGGVVVYIVVLTITFFAMMIIYPGLFYIMLIKIKKKPRKIHYFIAIVVVVVFAPFGIFAVVTQFLGDAGGH